MEKTMTQWTKLFTKEKNTVDYQKLGNVDL